MNATGRIGLAHEPAFALGGATVRPGTREVVRGGQIEVVEPRVMKVLVALAQANGAILSREDLLLACWEGRVVGDDAINRVMSRLRRVAEGVGGGFRVETITKVGYRLITPPSPGSSSSARAAGLDQVDVPEAIAGPSSPGRRRLIAGGALVAGTAAIGLGIWRPWSAGPSPPLPRSPTLQGRRLVDQSLHAICQGTKASQDEAIGTLRYVVGEEPDYADGWGALAMIYALVALWRPADEAQAMRERSSAAADHAQAIDPENSYLAVARSAVLPMRGNWLRIEKGLRASLAAHPRQDWLLLTLALLNGNVGRHRESAALFAWVRRQRAEHSPVRYANEILSTWSANRLEEADRLIEEASQLFPGDVAVWFARLHVQLYTGRPAASLSMIEDKEARPTLPADEVEALAIAARAMISKAPADVEAAMRVWLARARTSTGNCSTTVQLASAFGRVDAALALLRPLFFDARFPDPATPGGRHAPLLNDRFTAFLFYPNMAHARDDPRFDALMREMGFDRFWQESGMPPDYRRGR